MTRGWNVDCCLGHEPLDECDNNLILDRGIKGRKFASKRGRQQLQYWQSHLFYFFNVYFHSYHE